MPSVLVIRLGPEGGHLEGMPAFPDNHDAELAPDGQGAGEQFFDPLGPRPRRDVVVLRFLAQQKITHATAHPERRVPGLLQAPDNLEGGGTGR